MKRGVHIELDEDHDDSLWNELQDMYIEEMDVHNIRNAKYGHYIDGSRGSEKAKISGLSETHFNGPDGYYVDVMMMMMMMMGSDFALDLSHATNVYSLGRSVELYVHRVDFLTGRNTYNVHCSINHALFM